MLRFHRSLLPGLLLAAPFAAPFAASLAASLAAPLAAQEAPATAKVHDPLPRARAHAVEHDRTILLRIRGEDEQRETALDEALRSRGRARKLLYEYHVLALPHDSEMTPPVVARVRPGDDGGMPATPFLAALDPLELRPLGELAGTFSDEQLDAFLDEHVPSPVRARDVLADALREAKEDGKKVFVHTTAPWCGWCRRLEAFLGSAEIAPVFEKDYVHCSIDVDRMPDGKEVEAELKRDRKGGYPWMVVLDADGEELVSSNDPDGNNIGCPAQPGEIAWFLEMMDRTRTHVGDAERELFGRRLAEYGATLRTRAPEGARERGQALQALEQGRFADAVAAVEAALAAGMHPSKLWADPAFRLLREDAARRAELTAAARRQAREPEVTLVDPLEPGRRIRLEGRIVDADGTPVEGAVARFFHTDAAGEYRPGMTAGGGAGNPRLGGFVRTGADGRFVVDTIMPIRYPNQTVPRHVHYVVSADGEDVLTSECFFADDPGLDERARQGAKARGYPIVEMQMQEGRREVGHLEIRLP